MRRDLLLAILLCGCGPNVLATSDDSGDTGGGDDDDAATFEPSATQTDPTAGPSTGADGTSDGSQDTGAPETTSSEGGESNPFLIEPDAGSDTECDLWIDDCPVGQKCMPWANDGGNSWNATKCSPLAEDPKGAGEACTVVDSGVSGIDDCGPRAMCWNVDPETLMGECVDFCDGSEANPTCEDPCNVCPISNDGVLILCLPVCDPLLQDCNEGNGCYGFDETFICAPDASGDAGALGDPCEFINVCDPGLFCADMTTVPGCEAAACCATFCDVLADTPCAGMPDGVECIPWYEDGEAPPCGSGIVGVCLLPE